MELNGYCEQIVEKKFIRSKKLHFQTKLRNWAKNLNYNDWSAELENKD